MRQMTVFEQRKFWVERLEQWDRWRDETPWWDLLNRFSLWFGRPTLVKAYRRLTFEVTLG